MADPEIRAAHEHSVRCHRDKIAELRATENYERFYGELTGARMQPCAGCRPFRIGRVQCGAFGHSRGPARAELPPDFFFTVEFEGEAEH